MSPPTERVRAALLLQERGYTRIYVTRTGRLRPAQRRREAELLQRGS
jgi:hypothetical protein